MTAALFDDAMVDTAPLRRFVGRYANQPMFNDIAAEHARGRILLVGTTNIDARRPVIWNIGKLAASGHPNGLEVFRSILVASAAIPGAFPPVMIDVEVDGRHYQEMHVDGGASAQVFVYPPALVAIARQRLGARFQRQRRAYIIRNSRLTADWAETNRRTLDISGRAIQSLIQTQGVGDLYRIYSTADRDGVDFNLAYIPPEFTTPYVEPFETQYMNELFDLGHRMGREGYHMGRAPPVEGSPTRQAAASGRRCPGAWSGGSRKRRSRASLNRELGGDDDALGGDALGFSGACRRGPCAAPHERCGKRWVTGPGVESRSAGHDR
jgi:predicted acylesterase/phospholipase RssA